jgi:hypothetical protein
VLIKKANKGTFPVRKLAVVLAMMAVSSLAAAQGRRPFLSSLHATKDAPLYTTYAAALERSEFTLDEGYHMMFYDSSRGIEFTTDNAGLLSLGFRKGNRYVAAIGDMSSPPVITASYPDLVIYDYAPFAEIRVHATFFVYSSRLAVQEVAVTNAGTQRVRVDLLPYLRNSDRAFDDVKILPEQNAVTFSHEELPDGWVLDHGVPYVDKVHDIVAFSAKPDRMASFRSFRWGGVEIPQVIDLARGPVWAVWGRITHGSEERCRHKDPAARVQVMLNGDRSRMLIENAPRWGSGEANAAALSFYGVELGNFGVVHAGDTARVMVSCVATHEDGIVTSVVGDTAKSHNLRGDVHLAAATAPRPPGNVRRDIWGSGTELRLYWKGTPGVRYRVYRRDYHAGGIYECISSDLTQTFYTDKNIPDDKVYGYIVTAVDPAGRMSIHSNEVNNIEGSDFLTDVKYPGQVKGDAHDLVRVIAASKTLNLAPGATERFRFVRGVRRPTDSGDSLLAAARRLLAADFDAYLKADEALFSKVPDPGIKDPQKEMLYWTSFAMMRQVMLPPEGKCRHNYYVFSREPQWGWGHGGQVFHESLTMLAYAQMDPNGAMNSQRVFSDRQYPSGYINYRTGPYLDETIPYNGELTSSAPWYAWQNWEVYKLTKDKAFLEELYRSSVAFYTYYVKNRDSDSDGLCEWGGEAVLECVRDGLVAVWDQVGWPGEFEGLDCNAMLVMEAKSLAAMASELGRTKEAAQWQRDAADRARRINETFWDDQTGFYYLVDKKNHTFTYKTPNDLKRQEIIGFLPLWAGIADSSRARRIMQTLTDPKKFWRTYGVPSLSADDPYYDPKGYWNGPVWIEWDYLIERGLLEYGYVEEAREMVDRVAANMIAQLKKDHNLWEFYSPDDQWAGYHRTYIWAGIITRMMIDVKE